MDDCGFIPILPHRRYGRNWRSFIDARRRMFFVGNGSDEVLALAVRAFVEPVAGISAARMSRGTVQYFTPSYSLYPVLAETHGAKANAVPLQPDFSFPSIQDLRRGRKWDFNAALTLVTTPNAPSGRGYSAGELGPICLAQKGVVLLDEAYVDFADSNAMDFALKYPHVLVARTFSKAYSLCFQRVGYCVGNPGLIEALDKIRDSYNVNGLGQIAAVATLEPLIAENTAQPAMLVCSSPPGTTQTMRPRPR